MPITITATDAMGFYVSTSHMRLGKYACARIRNKSKPQCMYSCAVLMQLQTYSAFTLRKPCTPSRISGERGFLKFNGLSRLFTERKLHHHCLSAESKVFFQRTGYGLRFRLASVQMKSHNFPTHWVIHRYHTSNIIPAGNAVYSYCLLWCLQAQEPVLNILSMIYYSGSNVTLVQCPTSEKFHP